MTPFFYFFKNFLYNLVRIKSYLLFLNLFFYISYILYILHINYIKYFYRLKQYLIVYGINRIYFSKKHI